MTSSEARKKAKDHERQAKELRKEIKLLEAQERFELLAKFGEIIEGVIERSFDADDIKKFSAYANGIGKPYIINAMKTVSISEQNANIIETEID